MLKLKRLTLLMLLFSVMAVLVKVDSYNGEVLAQTQCKKIGSGASEDEVSAIIKACEQEVSRLSGVEQSLNKEISYLDAQINLTELKIQQTNAEIAKRNEQIKKLEENIDDLGERIGKLSSTIDFQNEVLGKRSRARYESIETSPLYVIFGSDSLSGVVQKLEYLRTMSVEDKKLLDQMRETRGIYDKQKGLLGDKKEQIEALRKQVEIEKRNLETYSSQLDAKKLEKKKLLEDTQNDEATYQKLLAQAKAELEAINAILGGQGIEDSGTEVDSGRRIATIIPTGSCNSRGPHLHFSVKKDGTIQNPFKYLKKASGYSNCSGSYCGSSNGDPFNPSGSWQWPISGRIQLNQGYGSTWATKYNPYVRGLYSFHDGIDIISNNLAVYAVTDGVYYRGNYTGTGGCSLKYVRLEHKDGLQTFYLHVNY